MGIEVSKLKEKKIMQIYEAVLNLLNHQRHVNVIMKTPLKLHLHSCNSVHVSVKLL